jgi:hypothetical protein
MSFTVNFGYKKSGRVLYIAHLSRNNSQELFFRFILSDIKATHYYDGLNKAEEDISSIDHLSIHKDGTAHIRYFGLSKKPKKISSNKLRPLIGMPQTVYLPLFILSLYDIDNSWNFIGKSTPLEYKGTPDIDFTWDIHERNQFSLVFFLVGGDVNVPIMLQSHFPSIFDIDDSPGLTNCFGNEINIVMANQLIFKENELRLFVGFTKKVIQRPPSKVVVSPNKLGSFDRVEIPIGFTVTQSDERINSLV